MKTRLVISLGSSKTVIFKKGNGVVLSEPSLVMCEGKSNFFGGDAEGTLGSSNMSAHFCYPIEMGAIKEEREALLMLKHFLKKVLPPQVFGVRADVVATFLVPCGLTNEQKVVFKNVAYASGISKVIFLPISLASKYGYFDVNAQGDAAIFCDVGGGKTDIAIVSGDNIIAGVTLGLGGRAMDYALMNYIERSSKMKVSLAQAQKLKEEIGSLYEGDRADMELTGSNIETRQPVTELFYASDVNNCVGDFYKEIAAQISNLIKGASSDMITNIMQNGIFLSGAAAQIIGFDQILKQKLSMPVTIDRDLELVAILGAAKRA